MQGDFYPVRNVPVEKRKTVERHLATIGGKQLVLADLDVSLKWPTFNAANVAQLLLNISWLVLSKIWHSRY